MNAASPFAVSLEEQFTVRELSILLPPHFVRADRVPQDQVVQLPLELLRASFQQGRPALKLSQIFHACPFLFQRQIDLAEDIDVALPFQKVERLLEAEGSAGHEQTSPFAAVMAGHAEQGAAGGGASPFAAAAPAFFAAGVLPPAASPFAIRGANSALEPEAMPPAASASPAPAVLQPAPTQLPVTQAQPALSSVFSHSISPPCSSGNGHATEQVPVAGPVGPAPIFAAALATAATPAAELSSSCIKVPLASLLRDVTPQELGFDSSAVAGTVEVEISADIIMPQLPTGRVEISTEELRAGVLERFRPAFARVSDQRRFVVPLTEIFRKLPANALPLAAAEEPVVTAPLFQTPFALLAEEEEKGRSPLPVMPLPPAPAPSGVTPFPLAPLASVFGTPVQGKSAEAISALPPVTLPSAPPAASDGRPFSTSPSSAGTPVSSAHSPMSPTTHAVPKLPNIPGMSGRPSPFSRPLGRQPVTQDTPLPADPNGDAHDDLGNSFSAGSLRAEPPHPGAAFGQSAIFAAQTPAPLPSGFPARLPVAPQASVPVHMPVPAPAPVSAPPAATPDSFSFGEAGMDDLVQLALRAIFLTAEPLTPALIAVKCATLPGLSACLIVKADGAKYGGSSQTGGDAGHFNDTAHRSIESLRMLAESLGQEVRGVFTLHSGGGTRTIFLDRTVSVAVLHSSTDFQLGVREKLTLVMCALADMKP